LFPTKAVVSFSMIVTPTAPPIPTRPAGQAAGDNVGLCPIDGRYGDIAVRIDHGCLLAVRRPLDIRRRLVIDGDDRHGPCQPARAYAQSACACDGHDVLRGFGNDLHVLCRIDTGGFADEGPGVVVYHYDLGRRPEAHLTADGYGRADAQIRKSVPAATSTDWRRRQMPDPR
jgi:hypothetical protein